MKSLDRVLTIDPLPSTNQKRPSASTALIVAPPPIVDCAPSSSLPSSIAPTPATCVPLAPLPNSNAPTPRPLFSSSSFCGPLNYFPCPATEDGVRCPRGSFVHAPYCRFHLRSVLKLDVDTSTIPGAGRGLFSLVARPVGFPLVDYMGELISAEETERRYPLNSSGTYCLKISNSFFIDSALSRGIGAIVNHPVPNQEYQP